MASYFRYLTFSFLKKISFWLSLIFSIAAIIVSVLLQALLGQNIESISIVTFGYLYASIFIFASIVVIHVFKEQETNGTDIFVHSTKLTRKKILITKFTFSIIVNFLLQILITIIATIIIFSINDFYLKTKINYILSIFLGGLIVSLIAISLAVAFST